MIDRGAEMRISHIDGAVVRKLAQELTTSCGRVAECAGNQARIGIRHPVLQGQPEAVRLWREIVQVVAARDEVVGLVGRVRRIQQPSAHFLLERKAPLL
jgi:hypothetical protein